MSLFPKKITKTYRFELRGIHNLNLIQEPTHGHGAELLITLNCPVVNEKMFLTAIKMNILNLFHKNDWAKAVPSEPTGENVLLTIWKIVSTLKLQDRVERMELVETKKNRFVICQK